MTGNEPPSITGVLYGYGALPWRQITTMLEGFVGVWGDVDGMHLAEPLPPEAPAYTHVWAWHGGVYARVRLDLSADRHILGVLTVDGEPPTAAQLPPDGQQVEAVVYPVRGWGDFERVAALPAKQRHPPLERLVTRQAAAVTFVRSSEVAIQ